MRSLRLGTVVVVAALSLCAFGATHCRAQDDDPTAALYDRILELRLSGNYIEAAAAAGELLELMRQDTNAPALDVEDASLLTDALQFAAGLPEEARLELARADSLGLAMEEFWGQGLYAEGAEAAAGRLAIYRRHFGDRHLSTATATDELASLLQYQGEYERAEPLFLEALDVRRETLGERHTYVGASLNNLGMLYQSTGDLESARTHITDARSILEESLGENDLNVAAITANLGMLLQYLGDFDGAERHLRKALTVRRDVLGDETPEVASSLNSLASLYYAQTDYAAAEPFLRRSTAIWQEILGDAHPHVALSLSNTGALLNARGEYAEAEAFHRQAVAIYRATLGDEHPDLAHALHNLAHALESEGDYASAEPLFREALTIRRAALGESHPDVAVSLNALAHALQAAGRYDEAEPLYREALAMHRELLGEEHLESSTDLSNLASLLEDSGRLDEALELYEEALDIRTRSLGSQSGAVAHNLSSIGHIQLRAGDTAQAERTLERAAATFDAARLRAGAGLSRATTALRLRPPLVALAACRLQLGKVDDAWPAAERALGRALADLLMASEERALTPAEAATEDSLEGSLAALEQELTAYLSAVASDTTGDTRALVDETRGRLLRAEAAWSDFQSRMSDKYPLTEGHMFPLGRVQAALEDGTAVVGWIDVSIADDDNESWGYVIRKSGPVAWARCEAGSGGDRSNQRKYKRYRDQLASPSSSGTGVGRDARGLWAERVEPLAFALEDVDELVVLPSGMMLGVPVETFVASDGVLLGDRFAVSYAPSATVYAWLEERGGGAGRTTNMLLLGDPPFTDADLAAMEAEVDRPAGGATRSAGTERASVDGLPRLPGSRDEVASLSTLSQNATVLLGPDATEQELVRLGAEGSLGEFGIIHLATHAMVDDERPDRSALVLSQVGLPDPLESALAGERIYDGLLTAGEIVREWDLECDLVTLSACETGLGREVVGEGYIGFAHAFFQAGARSLLVSLWKVEDTATSLLMRRFYENVFGSYEGARAGRSGSPMSKAEALREAKAWLRSYSEEDGYEPYAHPYYWSAFVLIGDRG
ncbi:MAG: CHAT domain-containing tetratricopeptide repeat protein [Candidatus Eisenbacteria bacterium]